MNKRKNGNLTAEDHRDLSHANKIKAVRDFGDTFATIHGNLVDYFTKVSDHDATNNRKK